MDRRGIKGIIDLHLEEEFRHTHVSEASNDTDTEGGPRLNNSTGCSDGDKTSEDGVSYHTKIVQACIESLKEDHGDTRGGSRDGCGNSYFRSELRAATGDA
jgi:hypothetical protein